MNRHRIAISFALVVAVLGLAAPVAHGQETPLKGRFGGVVSHEPVDEVTDYVIVEATGNATKLGAFSLSMPHYVNLPTRSASGYFVFTAANGDTLTAKFTGKAMPTATPGVIYIVETATIIPDRSTGRFAGATGSFIAERLYDRIAGTTIGTFEGTISLAVGEP